MQNTLLDRSKKEEEDEDEHQSVEETHIPWVEKYRPSQFDNIVLDPINRKLFQNILTKNYFPNLLFYGPPGTGKTTTIINLINEYQTMYHRKNKSTVIHLNASDERGIDIIRNQIHQFVKTLNLFEPGFKFVILDEVDYMTKNAQQALKYLLQISTNNVRFCLICNYISKIDDSLQNDFVCVRFNQLPKQDVHQFIKTICEKEELHLSTNTLNTIQSVYSSDIRSMINFIQLNQNLKINEWDKNIINSSVMEDLHQEILHHSSDCGSSSPILTIHTISIQYNIDKKNILLMYFNHIMRNHPELITPSLIDLIEMCMHNVGGQINTILQYALVHLPKILMD